MARNIAPEPTGLPPGALGGPTRSLPPGALTQVPMDMFNKRQEIDFLTVLQRNVEFMRENNISKPSTAEEQLLQKLLLEHYIRQAEASRRMQMQQRFQASQPQEQEVQAVQRGLETIQY